jgi:hypothetical protein
MQNVPKNQDNYRHMRKLRSERSLEKFTYGHAVHQRHLSSLDLSSATQASLIALTVSETTLTELHRKVSVQKLKSATQDCTTVGLGKSAIAKQR